MDFRFSALAWFEGKKEFLPAARIHGLYGNGYSSTYELFAVLVSFLKFRFFIFFSFFFLSLSLFPFQISDIEFLGIFFCYAKLD